MTSTTGIISRLGNTTYLQSMDKGALSRTKNLRWPTSHVSPFPQIKCIVSSHVIQHGCHPCRDRFLL